MKLKPQWKTKLPINQWAPGVYVVHVCGKKWKGIYEVFRTNGDKFMDMTGTYVRVEEKAYSNYKAPKARK